MLHILLEVFDSPFYQCRGSTNTFKADIPVDGGFA